VEYEDQKGEQVVTSSYQYSINMMSDMGFLGTLMNFPKEQINDETIELLQVRFGVLGFGFRFCGESSSIGRIYRDEQVCFLTSPRKRSMTRE
jgi:dynein heavy chain